MFFVFILVFHLPAGCGHVAGNYPDPPTGAAKGAVLHAGEGFLAVAGTRLELDRVRADLGLLRAQGFSARDPRILRAVARRERMPVSLIGDRSGDEFYRVRFRVAAGTRLVLRPQSVTLLLETADGPVIVPGSDLLLEDRRHPAGFRRAGGVGLVLEESTPDATVLVRAGLRGKIVGITVEPHLTAAGASGLTEKP